MFNTVNNMTKNSLNINAVNGTILKSYAKSFFVRFHLQSDLAKQLFGDNPKYSCEYVIVLQMMICGDMEVIAELIYKNDFEELFKSEVEQ